MLTNGLECIRGMEALSVLCYSFWALQKNLFALFRKLHFMGGGFRRNKLSMFKTVRTSTILDQISPPPSFVLIYFNTFSIQHNYLSKEQQQKKGSPKEAAV